MTSAFVLCVISGSTLAYTVDVHIIKESNFNQITTVQFLVSTNRTKINENISLNKNLDITELRGIIEQNERLTKFRYEIKGY